MPLEEFEASYRAHVGEVFAYAAARVGRSLAEDITADVFHAAARAVKSGKNDALAAPWLMTVARNKIIDHWRRVERRERKLHLLFQSDSVDPSLAAVVDRAESEIVGEVLSRLSTRHRLLLMMRYVDGLTTAELSGVTGLSVAAIESALARARRSFRKQYERLEARHA